MILPAPPDYRAQRIFADFSGNAGLLTHQHIEPVFTAFCRAFAKLAAPDWRADRGRLWNRLETSEKR